jgi:hypothetical protein
MMCEDQTTSRNSRGLPHTALLAVSPRPSFWHVFSVVRVRATSMPLYVSAFNATVADAKSGYMQPNSRLITHLDNILIL